MPSAAYDVLGCRYGSTRRPDPRVRVQIDRALGDARSVINVGAGTGSYEPDQCQVLAVEPSHVMILQRPAASAPVVRAVAERLPVRPQSFEAALAVLTVHHWDDWRAGLAELRRVASKRVVVLTWDPEGPSFWLIQKYFPDFLEVDARRFPTIATVARELGAQQVKIVPIPHDCEDGFLGAYWQRPEAYLNPKIRAGMSVFAGISAGDPRLLHLNEDLTAKRWDREFGWLRSKTELDIGYRLLVAELQV